MSKFDAEKFRKVYALVERGATEGERNAARQKARQLAANAGLSLSEALVEIGVAQQATHGPEPSQSDSGVDWRDVFREIFETPEFRTRAAEKEREDDIRRSECLDEYGSTEKLFDETEREAALSKAVEHLKEWDEYVSNVGGETVRYVSKLDGCNSFYNLSHLTPSILDAVRNAYAMPETVAALFDEYRYWHKLNEDRYLFLEGEPELWVSARMALISHGLDTVPVQNWRDMQSRLDWWQIAIDRETAHGTGWEQALRDRIAADMINLRQAANRVQSGHEKVNRRTNCDKRDTVLHLLKLHPELSNREIAKRAGVSPQTVLNWRNKETSSRKNAASVGS